MTPGKKSVRTVQVSGRVPNQGRPRLWAFGFEDYAELFGVSVEDIYAMHRSGFDFGDLRAICVEWWERKKARLVRDGEW